MKKIKTKRRFKYIDYYKSLLFYLLKEKFNLWFTENGKITFGILIFTVFFINFIKYSVIFYLTVIIALFLMNAVLWNIYFRPRLKVRRIISKYCTAESPLEYYIEIENIGKRWERGLTLIEKQEQLVPSYRDYCIAGRFSRKKRKTIFSKFKEIVEEKRMIDFYENEIADIAPGEKREFKCILKPVRRGNIHLKGFYICKRDPFSLMRRCKLYNENANIISLPKIYEIEELNVSEKRRYNQGGLVSAAKVGNSEEFVSLREYKPGDVIKRIHWKSFAKLQIPVIKEYNDEFFSRYGLLLDTFADTSEVKIFEKAVSAAASVIYGLELGDSLIDLMFLGDEPYIFTGGRGQLNQEKMLEILSGVKIKTDDNPDSMVKMVESHLPYLSTLLVILTDLDDIRVRLINSLEKSNVNTIIWLITDNEKKSMGIATEKGIKDKINIFSGEFSVKYSGK